MRNPGYLIFITMARLAIVSATRAQAQIEIEPPTDEIVRYSGEYMRTADLSSALFNGRLQSRLPFLMESMYLRDRNRIPVLDSWGREQTPEPVSPTESNAVGDILYDGVFYTGVNMRLDLYRDELVVAGPGNFLYGSVIDPSRLGYADLMGYRVIHMPAPATSKDIPGGYYLLLHDGRCNVLKKESYGFNLSDMMFTSPIIRYYVEKDGIRHRVGRQKGAILRLFRDRRSELNRYLRSGSVDLRNNTEKALVEIVAEYERLTR